MDFRGYRLESRLGAGSMSIVYRAVNTSTGMPAAVKIMNREIVADESYRKRFHNEAHVMSLVQHPNVIELYEYIDTGSEMAIIMELVDGRTLGHMISSETGPLPWERALRITRQAAAGVDAGHQRGIIHRDIKPSNIMVTYDDQVKILDMGIALGRQSHRLTRAGDMVGTLYYLAPEIIQGKGHSMQSDVYALGMTLYEVLTGTVPLGDSESSEFDIMNAIIHQNVPDPREFYPHIPAEVVNIVQRSTDKDPAVRYSTMFELMADMDAALGEGAPELAGRPEIQEVPAPAYEGYNSAQSNGLLEWFLSQPVVGRTAVVAVLLIVIFNVTRAVLINSL